MLRDRAVLRIEWFALGALVIATVANGGAGVTATPERAAVRIVDEVVKEPAPAGTTVEDTLREADELYRHGKPELAAEAIRRIANTDELRSAAELYSAYGMRFATATDPHATIPEVFEALRSAQALDAALGGFFMEDLQTRIRVIAPRAYKAYLANHDAANALLARHTAELFGDLSP